MRRQQYWKELDDPYSPIVFGLSLDSPDDPVCLEIYWNTVIERFLIRQVEFCGQSFLETPRQFSTVEGAKAWVTAFYPPLHEYIEHHTYTGPGCAICGKERIAHEQT